MQEKFTYATSETRLIQDLASRGIPHRIPQDLD